MEGAVESGQGTFGKEEKKKEDVATHIVPIFGSYNAEHTTFVLDTVFGLLIHEEIRAGDGKRLYPLIPKYAEEKQLMGEDREVHNICTLYKEAGWTPRQLLHLVISLARYVIVDDTVPSGAILEMGYARNTGTIMIVLGGKRGRTYRSSWMTYDFAVHSKDVIEEAYDWEIVAARDEAACEHLKEVLEEAIKKAEDRLVDRKREFEDRKDAYWTVLDKERGIMEIRPRSS